MDEVIKRLTTAGDSTTGIFDLPELVLALTLSFVLCLILAFTYKHTHRGLSYSVSFTHTMVIMGVTVAVIMMIIGRRVFCSPISQPIKQ